MTVGSETLPRVDEAAWAATHSGWRRTDDGALLLRTRDRFEPFTITVAR